MLKCQFHSWCQQYQNSMQLLKLLLFGGVLTAVTSELQCRLSWTSHFTFVLGGSNCSNFRTSVETKLNFTLHFCFFGGGGLTAVTPWYNSKLFISIVSKSIYIFNIICAYLLAINTVILVDLLGAKIIPLLTCSAFRK